ncbi:hypothetical protein Golomagni_02144 [Golovinomyces magnicellulatus]|nr:hypothetical protein Golomagni_02144 [Golovinomyces magnicellulatus]
MGRYEGCEIVFNAEKIQNLAVFFSGLMITLVRLPITRKMGVLLIFFVDMVLEDVTEIDYSGGQTKLSKILLNGNNICMLIPGGDVPTTPVAGET